MLEQQITIVAEEVEALRQRIIANMRSQGAVASGRTINSLRVEREKDGAMLVSDSRMPFGVLETGRRGGRVPMGFQDIILQWMRDKGVSGTPIPYTTNRQHKYTPQERGDRSLAYFISRKIRREGTRLFREGGRDTIYSQEIPKTMQRVEERVTALVSAYVDEQIKLNIKGGEE